MRSTLYIRFLFLLFLLYPTLDLAAQATKKFGASLSLEMNNGRQVQGGVLYEGDIVKGIIRFNKEQWDGKSLFYCYVFHYTEGQDIMLAYPAAADDPGAAARLDDTDELVAHAPALLARLHRLVGPEIAAADAGTRDADQRA